MIIESRIKSKRGLASADQRTRRLVASLGGRAAQTSGHAHRLTADERSRGGHNSPGNFSNRPHEQVVAAGRKGGMTSHGGGRPKKQPEQSESPALAGEVPKEITNQ